MFPIQRLPQRFGAFSQQCRRTITSSSTRYAERTDDPFANVVKVAEPERYRPAPSRFSPAPRSIRPRREPTRSSNEVAERVLQNTGSKRTAADAEKQKDIQDMGRQITRRWRAGDVYAPHDLTGVEMSKWKKVHQKGRPKKDAFDVLRLNPLDQYKNFTILSEYVSEMGRIKPMSETGLRPVNQRRIAKAIRRAIGIGLMPSVHKHPELLRKEFERAARDY